MYSFSRTNRVLGYTDAFYVYSNDERTVLGYILQTGNSTPKYVSCVQDDVDISKEVVEEFTDYARTGDYLLGANLLAYTADPKVLYDTLLVSCLVRRGTTHNIQAVISWLESTDFYIAPSTTRGLDTIPGGLLQHSLKCATIAGALWRAGMIPEELLASTVLCALIHDWWKINRYVGYTVSSGTADGIQKYSLDNYGTLLPTGTSTLYLAQQHVGFISEEEAQALVYAEGMWRCHDSEKDAMMQAMISNPLVIAVQTAETASYSNEIIKHIK